MMIKSYQFEKKTHYYIQVSYTDQKGKRYQRQYSKNQKGMRMTSKREAQQQELEYLIALKNKVEKNYQQLSFSLYLERFLSEIKISLNHSTVMQYNGDLKKWLSNKIKNQLMADITKSDIFEFIHEYMPSKGATPSTQKRILKSLKRVFESSVEHEVIHRNPTKGISVKVPPPKKEVLNTQEVTTLLETARSTDHPFYYLWAMALFTGMRNGELYVLRWSDIDEVTGVISVSFSWSNKNGVKSTKSNKNRIVPISGDLRKLLMELKKLGGFKETLTGLNGNSNYFDDLVLPRSTEWRHGEQSRITKRFCSSIQITPIKFHDLRATFITNMLSNGGLIPQVMSVVGHSRMSTTNEYLRLSGINVKGVTESLSYGVPSENTAKVLNFQSKF